MKVIKVDLPTDINAAEIHIFADLHIGDAYCDTPDIRKRIETVKNTPNAYVILNGDLMNNATKASVSDCYAEEYTPMEQLQMCMDLFEPIKDKIICITSGNHEHRTMKDDGIDLMHLLSKQLRLEDKYGKEGAVLFIRVGNGGGINHNRPIYYTAYCTHGNGGGRREGGKINRLADLAQIIDVDMYIMSHTHLPAIFRDRFWRVNGTQSSVANVERLFINTGASLNYGGYAQRGSYKPASKETPVIYLDGTKKGFWARL